MEPDFNIARLVRPDLVNFMAYSGATSPDTLEGKTDVAVKDIVKLDANENPYGCSPRVKKALGKYADFHVYTDDKQTKIKELLSGYLNIDAGHIVAGSGSNQLIDLVMRLLVNPGDEVISCPPTFGIYSFSTELCGGSLVEVPRGENFAVNIRAMKAAVTKKHQVGLPGKSEQSHRNYHCRRTIFSICLIPVCRYCSTKLTMSFAGKRWQRLSDIMRT